ncbi:MAG: 2-hydroxyacyl-CoA dehydratase family protein [Proteobacteria bacterium]|nr:2-hydroxyacyl-CoA dehydratase family protein [Pseudomonadota bacterium]MBU1717297.1 2-hydroxyacyl-CoA dehydratase family protein [Pseudomonadota bacterium]
MQSDLDLRFVRMQKTTGLHLAMEAENTLQQLTEFADTPQAMTYFYELFRNFYKNGHQLPAGKKVIGTMCLQVPDELILAAGAVPVRMCSGAYAYEQVGAEFLPAKSCPVVKATTGMLHINQPVWGEDVSAIVIPTTCDQKKKGGEMLKEMGYPVYILEMPASKDSDAARFYWQESVKKFALDLGETTGTRITSAALQAVIGEKTECCRLFRKLNDLRKGKTPLIFGKDIFLVTSAYFIDEMGNWQQAVRQLIAELEEREQNDLAVTNRQAPRLLLTGSPPLFPNLKVPILVEQTGGIIVADEVCSSNRLLYDAVSYDEVNLDDMVSALADRYLKPCTCPCLTPNLDRNRKIVELVNSHKVEGVIYQAFSGCLPYEMEQKSISQTMNEAGVPMLYLETDYGNEDLGQLSTRVEAFIESIKARRRKK